MVVTVTDGYYNEQWQAQSEAFLAEFLARMRQEPGVVEILHYADPESGAASTVVVWESEADVRRYRGSELIKEAIAFEKKCAEPARRAGPFPAQRYALYGAKSDGTWRRPTAQAMGLCILRPLLSHECRRESRVDLLRGLLPRRPRRFCAAAC